MRVRPSPSAYSSARISGAPSLASPEPEIPVNISVIEALGQTLQYNGRKVQIAGVFSKGLHGIFATQEHAKLNLAEYGVALSIETCEGSRGGSWDFSELDILDGQYVRVEATFSTRFRGEHSIFRAGLCDVVKVSKAGFLDEVVRRDAGK